MNLLNEKLRARGQHRLLCASAPDTSGMAAAAMANANISKDALDWYKGVYAEGAPDRAAASTAAREQAGLQRQLSLDSLQSNQEERDRYKSIFQPVEAKVASDALAYNTPEARDAAARRSSADAQIALSNARTSSAQALERRGVVPSAGKMLALQTSYDLGGAKLMASAANTARDRVETVGNAKLMDAAGLGRGVIGNQATQAQIGLSSGNSSVANANAPALIGQQGAQLMGQGFSTALQGNTSAGQMYGSIANAQAGTDAANGQQAAAAGTAVAGIAIAI